MITSSVPPLSDTWTSLMRSFGAAPFTSSLVSFMICPMWLSRSWYAFSQSTPVTCNHLQFLSDHCIDARLLPDGAGGSFRHLQKCLRLLIQPVVVGHHSVHVIPSGKHAGLPVTDELRDAADGVGYRHEAAAHRLPERYALGIMTRRSEEDAVLPVDVRNLSLRHEPFVQMDIVILFERLVDPVE